MSKHKIKSCICCLGHGCHKQPFDDETINYYQLFVSAGNPYEYLLKVKDKIDFNPGDKLLYRCKNETHVFKTVVCKNNGEWTSTSLPTCGTYLMQLHGDLAELCFFICFFF